MSFFLTLGIIDTKSNSTGIMIKRELAGATTIKREELIAPGDDDDVAINVGDDVGVNVGVDISDVGTKSGDEHVDDAGGDSIQGSSTPLKDKDDALETPRRPITRSQTKEFNDKLNGLQSLIQRFLIGEEELKPKGEELSKCYNYLVAQIQAQDEEF
ncbi:hypothetical protein MTR67_006889 [Solanum verrucosum]|uniref:Gag-pol polyprotein n=1 Tax=Solanum verrucosum TaxID=315347 RepID=A0AAF0Q4Z3_SOLVR|nr:hypothetical protein MTR67_006889 [Solanum verrucosum]